MPVPPRPRAASRVRAGLMVLLAVAVLAAGCSWAGAGGDQSGAAARPSAGSAGRASTTYSADPAGKPAVLATSGGQISGVRTGQVDHYRGIPFAAPPVGMLRFAAPAAPAPWKGVRDGSKDGPACTQTGALSSVSGEDCLYLSVARPAGAPTSAQLPMIIWVHGGAWVGGTGSQADATAMAGEGSAIVVTTNYRLGPLGYLVLPSLIQQSGGDAGNYATADVIAALRWIRANAASFGGDPGNVTIMGESAGSVNACALMASPAATGLFQKAILESGPCTWKLPTMQQAERSGLALAAKLGCVDAATAVFCLRLKPAAQIMTASAEDTEIFSSFTFSPATGGKILPLTPAQALWNGKLANIPIMIGTNENEGRPFTNYWAAYGPITDAGVNELIASHFPDRVDRVLAAYPPGAFASPRERLAQIITDSVFTCQATNFAQLTAGIAQIPTYVYEFDVPDLAPSSPEFGSGATHGLDLSYLFPTSPSTQLSTPARAALSKAMIGYWTRFAVTGDPNGTGSTTAGPAARWPRFAVGAVHTGDDRQLLTPDKIGPVAGTFAAHHCDVWS